VVYLKIINIRIWINLLLMEKLEWQCLANHLVVNMWDILKYLYYINRVNILFKYHAVGSILHSCLYTSDIICNFLYSREHSKHTRFILFFSKLKQELITHVEFYYDILCSQFRDQLCWYSKAKNVLNHSTPNTPHSTHNRSCFFS